MPKTITNLELDRILKQQTLEAVLFLKASSTPNMVLASEKFYISYDHDHGYVKSKLCYHDHECPNRRLSQSLRKLSMHIV